MQVRGAETWYRLGSEADYRSVYAIHGGFSSLSRVVQAMGKLANFNLDELAVRPCFPKVAGFVVLLPHLVL
jgi:hypothetical protein